jgi:multicomponent Na+:H+ antiporter subunit C
MIFLFIINAIIIVIGFYGIIISKNLLKKMFSLNIIQSGVIMFYLIIGGIFGSRPPILDANSNIDNIVDPLPQVLMLTAIVVGLSTFSVGMAILIKIKKKAGSIETDLINKKLLQELE